MGLRSGGEDTPHQAVVTFQARRNATWSQVEVQNWSDSASRLKVEVSGFGWYGNVRERQGTRRTPSFWAKPLCMGTAAEQWGRACSWVWPLLGLRFPTDLGVELCDGQEAGPLRREPTGSAPRRGQHTASTQQRRALSVAESTFSPVSAVFTLPSSPLIF